MTHHGEHRDVLRLVDGLHFAAGADSWCIESCRISVGARVAFVPGGTEPVVDPSVALARILVTLNEPLRGMVELFGQDVYKNDYSVNQRLRARIGFVHGYGGLLSNRTVRENVGLPVSIHSGLSAGDEERLVSEILYEFSLNQVADLYPHQMDGSTRWRACLARALVLEPEWLVMEGLGNWEMDRGRGKGWTCLAERQRRGKMSTAVCLPRQNPGFEAWFKENQGIIVPYYRIGSMTPRRPTE